MDLERLDEALAAISPSWFIEEPNGSQTAVIMDQDRFDVFLEAARAYRDLLANAERVEWCETHRSVVPQDWVWCETADANTRAGDCRIVAMLLVDPPKEEGTT